jgi:pyruvate dehydrogenase E2 component (dihydrolipoamide acetyltransferase)
MTEIVMPKLGVMMEEGTVLRWIRAEGDEVKAGEAVLEIETEKAAVEIEAPASGVLSEIAVKEGETVPVGTRLAMIAGRSDTRAAQPSARPSDGVDKRGLSGARESGLERPAEEKTDVAAQGGERSAPSSMRRIIGERMSESKRTIPHFYVNMEVDMTEVVVRREVLKNRENEPVPSINDFVLWASARALKEFPLLNASLTQAGLEVHSEIHLGMAVAMEEGLVVPVIRNADRLALTDLARRSRELIEKVQRKKLIPADYEGGTFTVTNLGMFGVESFTAIINPPQCAILAVGRVAPRVALSNGVVNRSVMTLTLSADHRIVDGVIAARFLQAVKALLERPEV